MLMPTDQLSDPLVMLGLFTTFAWLAAVLICWQKRLPPLGPLLVIPLAWFIPSNIFLIIGTILGERLILPLSCFVLIAVAAFIPWHRMIIPVRAIVFSLAAAFIFLFAYSTLLYLPAWQSNNHLQAYTISFHPLSGRFQGFWAVSLLIHGLEYPDQRDTYFKQAEYHARLALEYWPRNQQPYSVLGVIEHHRGNEDAAQRYLNYSRRGGGKWGIGEDFLASISQAQDQSAIRNNAEQLQKQLDDDPDNKALQLQLAIDYARLKEYPKAIRLFDKSVDIESETDFSILELYLDAAIARGTHEQVVQLIRRQLALRPDQWSILTDAALITMFDSKENSLEAKHWLERAIELSPGSPEPWAGLSMWYEIEGDQSKTLEMLNEALLRSSRDDPKWVHYQLRKEQLLERYKK